MFDYQSNPGGSPGLIFIRFENEVGPGLHPRDRTLPFTPVLSGEKAAVSGHGWRLLEGTVAELSSARVRDSLDGFDGLLVFELNAGQSDCVERFLASYSDAKCCTAAYGVYADACPEDVAGSGLVEFCVRGEGESVIPGLAGWVLSGRKGDPPPGLRWREDGEMRDSGEAVLLGTDDMPFVPAAILRTGRYHKNSFPLSIGRPLKWGFVLASRGCLHRCRFCTGMTRQSMDRRFRLCDPGRVVSEMEYQVREGRRTIISVEDDLFTGDREWAVEVCELLERRGWRHPWIVQTRFDRMDEELARRLKAVGCAGITCGVESGSDIVLENLNKNTTAEKIRESGKLLNGYGFAERYTVMIGSPGETREDFDRTSELISELNPLTAQLTFCTPYPDTGIADNADRGLDNFRFEAPSRNLSEIPEEELVGLRIGFYKKHYLSMKYLKAHAREWLGYSIFNPWRALNMIWLFLTFVRRQSRMSGGANRAFENAGEVT